jgi:hypothetical protein
MVALLAVNVQLQRRNASLVRREGFYRQYYAAFNSPAKGTELPELTGAGSNGPWRLNLKGSSERKAILLFNVDCSFCEQNWKSWEELLARDESSNRLLPIATSEKADATYLARHHLRGRRVWVGLDRYWQALLRLAATPQTIVERDGVVEKSWVGILSDSDLREVESALNEPRH